MPRGRKPKPTRVKELAGNPGKRPLNEHEPKPENPLAGVPAHLTPAQAKLWTEALAEAPKGLLTSIDGTALEAYCVWKAVFQQANKELVERSRMTIVVKGEEKPAPELAGMAKATLLMLKACVEMGFTPSSRSRLNIEPAAGEGNEFGDV